jgi:hypothetical protein
MMGIITDFDEWETKLRQTQQRKFLDFRWVYDFKFPHWLRQKNKFAIGLDLLVDGETLSLLTTWKKSDLENVDEEFLGWILDPFIVLCSLEVHHKINIENFQDECGYKVRYFQLPSTLSDTVVWQHSKILID